MIMMKLNKALLIFTLFSLLTTSTGCNKITKNNYNKIEVGMTMEEVIEILGNPTEKFTSLTYDSFLWVNKGNTFSDAVEMVNKGIDVEYIEVVFSIELNKSQQIVLRKEFGDLKKKLSSEEVTNTKVRG